MGKTKKPKHLFLATIAAVRAEYFRRWETTPITHPKINPGGPDYPVMFHRECPLCGLPVSWQGWFTDLKDVAVDMGKSHWISHGNQATSESGIFWMRAIPMTRLIPVGAERLLDAMEIFYSRQGKAFQPYREAASYAAVRWPLMRRAGVPVFKRGPVLLFPEAHWDLLITIQQSGQFHWQDVADDTYADMARERRRKNHE